MLKFITKQRTSGNVCEDAYVANYHQQGSHYGLFMQFYHGSWQKFGARVSHVVVAIDEEQKRLYFKPSDMHDGYKLSACDGQDSVRRLAIKTGFRLGHSVYGYLEYDPMIKLYYLPLGDTAISHE